MTKTAQPARKPNDLDRHEREVFDGAVAFSAFIRVSPFDRRRAEAPTVERAIEEGARLAREAERDALLYAINGEGRSVMFGSVDQAGVFKSALRA